MPFAEWEGSQIVFYQLDIFANLNPLDIVIFPSNHITHFNLCHKHKHGSVVTTDKGFAAWVKDENGYAEVILHHCKKAYVISCPLGHLDVLTEIAVRAEPELPQLAETLRLKWLERLLLEPDTKAVSHALDVGERHGWREFQGHLYFRQAVKICSNPCSGASLSTAPATAAELTSAQKSRLMIGCYSLTLLWDRFYTKHADVHDPSEIVHVKGIRGKYVEASQTPQTPWTRKLSLIAKASPCAIVNIPARVERMRQALRSNNAYHEVHDAESMLSVLLDDFNTSLPDHFLGPITVGADRSNGGTTVDPN
ncbi:hypothetical protein C8J56DRAFT_1065661 [Mycena floridula]|nr:hypothetical protein C8J56DRAFT_1065661 [Mycena floridula]